MSVLTDWEIEQEIEITPRADNAPRKGIISYGLSSYGYDIRVGRDYRVFTDVYGKVVDPKAFDAAAFVEINNQDHCIIPPNSFALAASVEHIKMPEKIIGLFVGKSTYARCGIIVNITPIENEWSGHITIEISNTTPLPCKIYSEEGIGQLLFLRGEHAPRLSYKGKKGVYMNQTGITLPKIRQ